MYYHQYAHQLSSVVNNILAEHHSDLRLFGRRRTSCVYRTSWLLLTAPIGQPVELDIFRPFSLRPKEPGSSSLSCGMLLLVSSRATRSKSISSPASAGDPIVLELTPLVSLLQNRNVGERLTASSSDCPHLFGLPRTVIIEKMIAYMFRREAAPSQSI